MMRNSHRFAALSAFLCLFACVPSRSETLSASYFNVYSIGSINYRSSDFEGAAGTANDFYFEHFLLGKKSGVRPWTLVVGGNTELYAGAVLHGGVLSAGDASIQYAQVGGNIVAGGRITRDHAGGRAWQRRRVFVDHEAIQSELFDVSRRLAALPPSAKAETTTDAVHFPQPTQLLSFSVPAGSNLAVFDVSAETVASAGALAFHASPGTTLVVNVSGSAPSICHKADSLLEGVEPGSIIFNFPNAQSLDLCHARIDGTVLAPWARVTFVSGQLNGDLYVGGLSGNGQVNQVPDIALWGLAGSFGQTSPAPLPSHPAVTCPPVPLPPNFDQRL